jgi:hypothetical protein
MEFVIAAHHGAARSGYVFLEIEQFTRTNCQPYTASWMSAFLSLSRYAPLIITAVLYIAGFYYKELYLFLFGLGLSIDAALGYALSSLIANEPRVATCVPVFGSALAYPVQHAAFFVTFVLGYFSLYRPRAKLWHIALLLFFYTCVVLGAHFLNYYDAPAVVAGAALGTLNAFVYQALLFWLVVPHMCAVLRSRIVRYLKYRDTLCSGETAPAHVVALENFDREFGGTTSPFVARADVRQFLASQTF